MANPIPESYLDLFQKRAFAHVATIMADGTPQVTPVWVDFDGEHILINSSKGRLKDRNMEERRQVALDILDPDNPYRFLAIRGPVVEITEQGADEHIDRLSQRYTGQEKYGFHQPGDVRRIYKVRPEHVLAQG